jgi:hypothetical protein
MIAEKAAAGEDSCDAGNAGLLFHDVTGNANIKTKEVVLSIVRTGFVVVFTRWKGEHSNCYLLSEEISNLRFGSPDP